MPPAKSKKPEIALLYQPCPKQESWRSGTRSNYDSIESYHREALHEWGRLTVNGTIPNHIVQVNYLTMMPKEGIQALWKKQSRRLYNAGIVARVGLEIDKLRKGDAKLSINSVYVLLKEAQGNRKSAGSERNKAKTIRQVSSPAVEAKMDDTISNLDDFGQQLVQKA